MIAWNMISEDASIVLVGNLNPAIFHPEWFIRKGIIESWDYSKDDVIIVPDMARFSLPSNRKLQVVMNKFMILSSMASDHLALKDIVMSTFTALRETPITQMGMNYTSIIKLQDNQAWGEFGRQLAPNSPWEQAVELNSDLDEEQLKEFGLWELTMNLPRSDGSKGFIRPKITAISIEDHTLSFSINNHIQIEDSSAATMIKILERNWEKSLDFARDITSKIMGSQLGSDK